VARVATALFIAGATGCWFLLGAKRAGGTGSVRIDRSGEPRSGVSARCDNPAPAIALGRGASSAQLERLEHVFGSLRAG
jgi:hypothetical protein